ncbi:hypothetical protein [Streptomyces collinus]|uniref:hypothetical protein n=1 Tax=Streptomyces collinus TaxID=42684 RepID=UPI0033EF1F18
MRTHGYATGQADAHIDHAADVGEVYVPDTARAVVERLRRSGETHVWWWPLGEATDPADFVLLDEQERARMWRFHARPKACRGVSAAASCRSRSARTWTWSSTPLCWSTT